jgi:hypothetical protein
VSVRFEDGWLAFSEPHESDMPTAQWSIRPNELGRAVAAAQVELEGFARRLRSVLADMRVPGASLVSRKMAGLVS